MVEECQRFVLLNQLCLCGLVTQFNTIVNLAVPFKDVSP